MMHLKKLKEENKVLFCNLNYVLDPNFYAYIKLNKYKCYQLKGWPTWLTNSSIPFEWYFTDSKNDLHNY